MFMIFFAIGYTLIWLLLFGYTLAIHGQQRKLEREISLLNELVREGTDRTVS